jgi:hypothetical protein
VHLERNWTAWWAGELDRPIVMIEGRQPHPSDSSPPLGWEKLFASEFPLETPVESVLDHYQWHLETRRLRALDAFDSDDRVRRGRDLS